MTGVTLGGCGYYVGEGRDGREQGRLDKQWLQGTEGVYSTSTVKAEDLGRRVEGNTELVRERKVIDYKRGMKTRGKMLKLSIEKKIDSRRFRAYPSCSSPSDSFTGEKAERVEEGRLRATEMW